MMKWYENECEVVNDFLKKQAFVRIGKEVDWLGITNDKEIFVNTNPSICILKRGFLIDDPKGKYLVLPFYVDVELSDDEILYYYPFELNEYKIPQRLINKIDIYSQMNFIYLHRNRGYFIYRLDDMNKEFIEGKIEINGEEILNFMIYLYDLELIQYENLEAFLEGVCIFNHKIVYDVRSFVYEEQYENIEVDHIHISNLYMIKEDSIPNYKFNYCEFSEIHVMNQDVIFEENSFNHCTCKGNIVIHPKHESYFRNLFPDASIFITKE